MNRLYTHTIEKRMASYHERKDRYMSQGLNCADLLDEIQQLKDAMMKAAEEQNAADTELLEKRTVVLVRTFKKKRQLASAVAEEEVASIRRHLRAVQDQPIPRTPTISRIRKVEYRTCITNSQQVQRRSATVRREMSLSRPVTSAPVISTPPAGSRQRADTARPSTQTHSILTPSSNSRPNSHTPQQSTQVSEIMKLASKNIARRPLGTLQNSLGIRMSAPVPKKVIRR